MDKMKTEQAQAPAIVLQNVYFQKNGSNIHGCSRSYVSMPSTVDPN
jgi:hypothetical protein